MARGPRRSFIALLTSLALAGCVSAGAADSTAPTTPSTTSTSTSTSTSTTIPTTTTGDITGTIVEQEIDAEVTLPDGEGPFPTVVLVHGGGWVSGGPGIMRPLADHLAGSGFLTVNTRYRLATLEHPAFPEAIEDVACAVRYAAGHPQSDGSVTVIGHSAGAHIGAVVALTGDMYQGECPFSGSGTPDRFVGLAGPYDVTRIGLAMSVFFGEGPAANPEAWSAGNPQALADGNPGLVALIMYGELDGLVDDRFAFDFRDALAASGSEALVELVEGARHNDMHDPARVGDLIVAWLTR
jgi:acetyl esterase/lipase